MKPVRMVFTVAALTGAWQLAGWSAPDADKPVKVIDLLDCFAQARFEKADKRFGVSRLVTPQGHNRVVFNAETPEEKRLFEQAKGSRRDYGISFVHIDKPQTRPPGLEHSKPRQMVRMFGPRRFYLQRLSAELADRSGPASRRQYTADDSTRDQARMLAIEAATVALDKQVGKRFDALKRGDSITVSDAGWTLALRPVKARESCLSCHSKSKEGDTLGAMAYVVNNSTAKPN